MSAWRRSRSAHLIQADRASRQRPISKQSLDDIPTFFRKHQVDQAKMNMRSAVRRNHQIVRNRDIRNHVTVGSGDFKAQPVNDLVRCPLEPKREKHQGMRGRKCGRIDHVEQADDAGFPAFPGEGEIANMKVINFGHGSESLARGMAGLQVGRGPSEMTFQQLPSPAWDRPRRLRRICL